MERLPNIAPGETQRLTWTFTLASGETITSKTVAGTLLTAGTPALSGGTVTCLVTPTASTGTWYAQLRVVTSDGRQLDKTFYGTVAHYKFVDGFLDPDDTDDVTMDFASELGSETIIGFTPSVVSGTVTLGATDFDSTTATVRMSGGVAGGTVLVLYTVTTSGGRTLQGVAIESVAQL